MKIKELKRTVNMSWSPAELYPAMLATGSAAQQVDASFSSNSTLELYSLNLSDPSSDLELKSSIQTEHKFQKLVWSGAGVIVAGGDGGLLEFYNVEKLLNNSSEALIGSRTKHSGQVSALDINPYQNNLLASGASESEIFIWDLNNTSQPMTPGTRSTPHHPVQGLAWNQQVQHILGSTFATRCLVWDLRKNEPIMKLSDSQCGGRWRALAWHPRVATQLCVASDNDAAPVLQLWDLRLAASPLVTLEGHEKGALSLSWSAHDEDLLLSAGKDGRVLAWNPNNSKPGGDLLLEVSRQSGWVFEVSWAPRIPGVLAAAAFDQSLALHTLHHVTPPTGLSAQGQSDIMDSFGGADSFLSLPAVAAPAAPAATSAREPPAPRWLRRPAAARFAFGGKLVTFEKCPRDAEAQKLVYISQVVSDPEIVEKALELDKVISLTLSQELDAAEQLAEYCRVKGDAAEEQHERYVWFFLRANFMPSFRTEILNLLGFKQDDIPSKFKGQTSGEPRAPDLVGLSRTGSTETEAELSTDTSTDLSDAQTLIEKKLASVELEPMVENVVIPTGEDATSVTCRALVLGRLEHAVELCLEAGRVADALIIASLGSQELLYKVQKYHLRRSAGDPVSLIAGSLLQSNWDALVQRADAGGWRDVLAALLTHCDGESLAHYCEMLGDRLSSSSSSELRAAGALCLVCAASERAARGSVSAGAAAERALLLRAAARVRGREVRAGGAAAALLGQYAARLAAQGCLRSALAALQGTDLPLQERLETALRMRDTLQHQPHQRAPQNASRSRTVSGHSHTRGHYAHTHNDVNNTYSQQVPEPPSWSPALPPRPPSATPQPGGISGRSKYKVDPSVQAPSMYNQYGFNNPLPPQPSYGYNSPLPDQYAATVPTNNFAPINRPNPVPLNPSLNPLAPANLPLNPPGGANLQQHPPAPSHPSLPSESFNGSQYLAPRSAPGWNDPPMVTNAHKPKQEIQQQAPITHPLFGVEPPQHVPLVPQMPGQNQYPGQGQNQYPGQNSYPGQNQFPPQGQFPGQPGQFPGQQGQFPGQQEQFPGQQQFPDQYQAQYPPGYQQNYSQQSAPPPAAPPPAPAPRPPLPAEHEPLKNAFDELYRTCLERANSTQVKRKLEDVQRRLETLYDMLRENKLSPGAVSSLRASASQACGGGSMAGALAAVADLAAGNDFAAAASFLPGLKMLFLLADQLR